MMTKRTVFLNGVGNSYDAKEFKENPINIHKIGTKEALKDIMLYHMCEIAEVQRVVVEIENGHHIDITGSISEYIKKK
jgi:hypothetical protein